MGRGYSLVSSGGPLRICPLHVFCGWPHSAALDALVACSQGVSASMLAEVTSDRFTTPYRSTTVYLFGDAGRLPAGENTLVGAELGVAVASDITD